MQTIVGVDEVGRGPLAGPVTVCVVACEKKFYTKLKKNKHLPPPGKDSKKLSPTKREEYAKYLKYVGLPYVIIHVSNKIIDKKGISFAVKKAICQGMKDLKLSPKKCEVLLDGGLKAPEEFKNQKTIIKGDEKEKIIAWASILAKVSRDALMCRLAVKYPQYGFEFHKGYGTRKHCALISKFGLCTAHRRSFCKKLIMNVK